MTAPDRATRLMVFAGLLCLFFSFLAGDGFSLRATVIGHLFTLAGTMLAALGIRELAYLLLGEDGQPWYGCKNGLKVLLPLMILVAIVAQPTAELVREYWQVRSTPPQVGFGAVGCTLLFLAFLEQLGHGALCRRRREPSRDQRLAEPRPYTSHHRAGPKSNRIASVPRSKQ